MARVPIFIALSLFSLLPADGVRAEGELTLEEALRLTLERNPRLAALREGHLAASGRRIDAGAWPNPEISFEAENLRFGEGPGSRGTLRASDGSLLESSAESVSNSGFRESELTLSVSQSIELGGKRSRRIALAEQGIQVALWDYEVERANAIARTRQAFIEVLAAQERLALRRRLAQLAGEAAAAVGVRVDSGKDSPILRDRSEIEHAQARIELGSAERALAGTRYALAAQWDEREPDFAAVAGDLYQISPLLDAAALQKSLERSPDSSRWMAEVSRREAALSLERSLRAPDLTVSAGWRGMSLPDRDEQTFDSGGALVSNFSARPEDRWEHSLVFGVSVPLPLFRRNRGGIAEAEHLALQATHELRAGRAEAWARVSAVRSEVEALHAEILELRGSVMPAAERAYAAAQVGFEGGKFTFLDVLDSQRTLFRVQSQNVEAHMNYQRGVAELERLIGAGSSEGTQR